jgi:hypothetical protein
MSKDRLGAEKSTLLDKVSNTDSLIINLKKIDTWHLELISDYNDILKTVK